MQGIIAVGRATAAASLLALVVSCSSRGEEVSRQWVCFEGSTCTCAVVRPGWIVEFENEEVPYCAAGSSCCLLTERGTDAISAECVCFDTEASCDAEAASRRNTTAVSECPPPGAVERVSPACAAIGENCRGSYLEQNELSGCCPGTICRPNDEQVPVCAVATEEEIQRAAECRQAARGTDSLELLTPTLRTDAGDITLSGVGLVDARTGPSGCLNALLLFLGDIGSGCALEFRVELVGGTLMTTAVSGEISNCPGYIADPTEFLSGYVGGEASLAFSFEGLACEAGQSAETYCLSGKYDFQLAGTFGTVTFEDQRVGVSGATCAHAGDAVCPSSP